MRKFAKLLPIMMCMVVMLAFGVAIKAEAANVTTGKLGNNKGIIWTYDGDTKTLTITGDDTNLAGDPTKGSQFKSKEICPDVEYIKLENCKLYNCYYLFAGLDKVKSVTFDNFDTSEVTSMTGMFYQCTGLEKLDLSSFDTTSLKHISNMFDGCSGLLSLDLSSFQLASCTSFDAVLNGCEALRLIITPENMPDSIAIGLPATFVDLSQNQISEITKGTSNITLVNKNNLVTGVAVDTASLAVKVGESYQLKGTVLPEKAAIKTLTWKSSDTSVATVSADGKVTAVASGTAIITATANDGSGRSSKCSVLVINEDSNVTTGKLGDKEGIVWAYNSDTKTLTITGEDTGVTGNQVDGSLFKSENICPDVENIIVENCKLYDCTCLFAGLKQLQSITFDSFDTSDVTKMYGMFYKCTGLKSLDLSELDTSKVENMMYMFNGCKSLTSLNLGQLDTSSVDTMDSMFYDCSSLTTLDLSSFDTSKVTDMSSMFNNCSGLTTLDLSSFNTSKVTDMSSIFARCSGLTTLDLSGFDTSEVTSMHCMFWMCSGLTSLKLDKIDTSKVKYMGNMFSDCRGITSLNLSSFDTSNVETMESMFSICTSLTTLDLSNFDTSKVTDMSHTFSYCGKLNSLDLSSFDTSGVTNMESMFYGCLGMTSLDVSGFNTSNVTSMDKMFYRCEKLTGLDLSGFDLSSSSGMLNMLVKCDMLTSIHTPKIMPELSCIELPGTYVDLKQNETTVINEEFANTILINVNNLITGMEWKDTVTALLVGDTYQMQVDIVPVDAVVKTLDWKSSDKAVATVDSNGKVTAVGAGRTTITATAQDGTGISISCVITVTQPVTGITLNKTSLSLKTGGSATLTATVSPSNASNKEVSWKSSDTSVATVDTSGKVTAVAPGSATITATAKDGSGKSASCTITVTQPVTGISLNKTSLSLKMGGSATLTATVAPSNASNKEVSWKSSDTSVATVDTSGKVTAVAVGSATITVTAKDGSGKSASCTVTVTQPVTGITLNKTSLSLKTGGSASLTATVSPSNASNKEVSWKSSDTSVATVDTSGKVTAVAPGSATITVTAKDGSGKSASCTVTVTQPVTGITLNKTSLSLKTGGSASLTATVSPSNASNKGLTWKSSDTAVATVDSNGKITAVAPGSATIIVTAKDGSGKSDSCTVTVTQPVTGITLNKTSLSLKVGGSTTLTATISPSNASNKEVSWKSSDTSIATVDTNGKVTAVAPGSATITVTTKDGSGKSDSCTVTVTQPVTGITLDQTSLNLKEGGSETLVAIIAPANASNKAVSWKSSDTSVATVDSNGKVTAVALGSATITATTKDGSGKSADCTVTVTKKVQLVTGITLDKNSLSLKTGETATLAATVSPSNASNKGLTWKSSDTAVATVDVSGKVIAVAPGTATITITAKDGSEKSNSCTVTVTQPVTGITLNQTSLSLKTGGSATLTATVSPSNASNKGLTWKSSDTSVATVDSNGKITAVAVGSATITVTTKDGSGKSNSCTVTVTQPVTGISLNKTSLSLKTGGSATLTATVSPSNASNKGLTWKSSDPAVVTVDSNGKVTAVAVGSATITVTAKDGSGKSASCSVTVTQPVTGITLNKTSLSLKIGESATLTATVSPSNASNKGLIWKSSDTSVATVDSNGKITAVAVGSATVTVTAKDGSGKSASCIVTVAKATQPVTGITLDKTSLNLKTGGSATLTATVTPSNASNKGLTWKSSDTSVATVDTNGKVTAVAVGSATITVTAKDGSGKSNSCTVTVTKATQLVTGITLDKSEISLKTGATASLTATVSPSDASNKEVTWESSDSTVAAVDEKGTVTALSEGTATITATAKDGSGKNASCTITVKDENPFADVKEDSWQYPFVKFVYDHNIMAGKGKTAEGKIIFDPDNYMTRAEFVQTLYNKEGKPAVTYEPTFTDVPEGQWYTNAILWASQNGIAAGKGERFDISGKITREEVATILYKYATNYKKYDTSGRASLDAYEDTDRISSWAVNNMKWAIHYGIMKGRGNVLAPWDNASRAECATMIKNFMDAYND